MTEQAVLPTCYRHPDRETRLACSNCERPVCVDCVRPAAVGQRCLECINQVGEQRVMDMQDVQRRSDRLPPVTMLLLIASVGVFAVTAVIPALDQRIGVLFAQINPLIAAGEWWRMLTAAFLHGGLLHLGFNMYALYLFGPELERRVGSVPFAAMYAASALAGGAAYYLSDPNGLAVGASGAIFGLFGSWLAASYRGRHTTLGRESLRQLLTLLGINLAIGFVPGFNIAWQAHVGGLVAGVVITMLWATSPLQRNAWARTAVAVAVAMIAIATVV